MTNTPVEVPKSHVDLLERPLFAHLRAVAVPTGVLAAADDWGEQGLAARIEGNEQQAAGRETLLAELLEPEDDRRRLAKVVDAGREHPRQR